VVRIDRVELRRLSLPLVRPWRTVWGTENDRDVLVVRVCTPSSEGWGECVALRDPVYTSEYVDGAHAVVRDHLVPRLVRGSDVRAETVAELLAPVKGHHMAKAAVETAVLDAELRAEGRSLASYLGGVRTEVDVGVSVGVADDIGALLAEVDSYVASGYRRVKLKIVPGWDVEPVQAVRDRFPELALQVDANAAYALDDWEQLAALDPFELVLLEQPLASDDLYGHAQLAKLVRTPICLDESITSAHAAAEAIELGAAAIVNIKPGRVGGLLEARRIHDLCELHGVAVWCGGMLETGIGRAANVALASLPNFTLPGDISASDRYFEQDVTPPFVLRNGRLAVPDRPGIGVDVLGPVVESHTTAFESITV
jgi:O-succinylbenzoate synthase